MRARRSRLAVPAGHEPLLEVELTDRGNLILPRQVVLKLADCGEHESRSPSPRCVSGGRAPAGLCSVETAAAVPSGRNTRCYFPPLGCVCRSVRGQGIRRRAGSRGLETDLDPFGSTGTLGNKALPCCPYFTICADIHCTHVCIPADPQWLSPGPQDPARSTPFRRVLTPPAGAPGS